MNFSKKGEVSNRTLGILIFLSITLSLIGTFISLNKTGFGNGISGYLADDTSTAIVNLTVDQVLDVNFTTASVDWTEGSVDPGETSCTLNTNASGASTSCTGFADKSNSPLVIQNIGNKNVSLNLSFSNNAGGFIGGTNPAYKFWWNCSSGFASSCKNSTGDGICAAGSGDDNIGNSTTWAETWNNANTNSFILCPIFSYTENNDKIDVHTELTIPVDSFTGNLSSTVTATAYTADIVVE